MYQSLTQLMPILQWYFEVERPDSGMWLVSSGGGGDVAGRPSIEPRRIDPSPKQDVKPEPAVKEGLADDAPRSRSDSGPEASPRPEAGQPQTRPALPRPLHPRRHLRSGVTSRSWPKLAVLVVLAVVLQAVLAAVTFIPWSGTSRDRTPFQTLPPKAETGPSDSLAKFQMKLVLIPAGEFLMGSPDSDKDAQDDEKPQHRVRITRPFYLGATEVTVGQFRRVVETAGYQTEAEKDGKGGQGWNEAKGNFEQGPQYTWRNPGFAQTDEHPVVNVSWNDAIAFCNMLSEQGGFEARRRTVIGCRRRRSGNTPAGPGRRAGTSAGMIPRRWPWWETSPTGP